jgi:hypothetical protein
MIYGQYVKIILIKFGGIVWVSVYVDNCKAGDVVGNLIDDDICYRDFGHGHLAHYCEVGCNPVGKHLEFRCILRWIRCILR